MSDDIVSVDVPAAELISFLELTGLFAGCEARVREHVVPALSVFSYPAGSEVLSPGSAAEAVGIVQTGRVEVRRPAGGVLELLLPGESVSEQGAFEGLTFPFEAVTPEGAQMIWLSHEDAKVLVQRVPAFAEAIGARLAKQIARLMTVAPVAAVTLAPGEIDRSQFGPHHERATGPGIAFVELSEFDLQPSVLALVPSRLIQRHRLVPVRLRDRRLTVAMVAPRDLAAISELRRVLQGVDLEVVAISSDDYNAALHRLRLDEPRAISKGARSGPAAVNPDAIVWDTPGEERDAPQGKGDDVVRFVNKMVAAAIDKEASDIHIEPAPNGVRVRFRIQGTLSDWTEPVPVGANSRTVATRIKVLSGMDVAERRMPQDGRIGFAVGKREMDLRVSTIPASRGEKVALRLLEGSAATRPLDRIFLESSTLGAVRAALQRPYGGILVGGPTGSGKTSTLYSLLNERRLTRPDSQVLMVEDPVEYRMPGAVQVQVNPTVGLGFAQVLRAAMRQDPDVIVVGEMRDSDTAHLALEAAMTGHLLLSSVHASDSRALLQRLESLGSSRAMLAQSLSLVLVQRLVRRLCTSCKVVDEPAPALVETLIMRGLLDRNNSTKLPRANGCDACNGTGAAGRVAVIECLQITDHVRNALAAGRPLEEIERTAYAENVLMTFRTYGQWLLEQQIISAPEALLALAE